MLINGNSNSRMVKPGFAGQVVITDKAKKILPGNSAKTLQTMLEQNTPDEAKTFVTIEDENRTILKPQAVLNKKQPENRVFFTITDVSDKKVNTQAEVKIPLYPSTNSGSVGYIEKLKPNVVADLYATYLIQMEKAQKPVTKQQEYEEIRAKKAQVLMAAYEEEPASIW